VNLSTAARRWLREPLLHFLLLGSGLFGLYGSLKGALPVGPREIIIGEARTASLAEGFARTWMRPPTAQELQAQLDDYIKEEVFAREALALGLDRDDPVIRRRLRQKMAFLSEQGAALGESSDAELERYLSEHAASFVAAAGVSFQQLFFDSERRGESAQRDAERTLAELRTAAGTVYVERVGDPTMLPQGLTGAAPQEITGAYGEQFAEQLERCPTGAWCGPVRSAYGLHLVRVTERSAGALPKLSEIRPALSREWQAEQRRRRSADFYAALRAKYRVRFEAASARLLQAQPSAASAGWW
jgi:parvulin-like peptidyl-prolyl isomerase